MLDELAGGAADVDANGAQHALVGLVEQRIPVLFVLDVDVEGFALEEDLEVGVVVEDGVGGDLVQHALEGLSPRLDELGVEAADGLLLGGRGDDDAGVVGVHGGVEPEEVSVPAGDGELGLFICFGRGLLAVSEVGSRGAGEQK